MKKLKNKNIIIATFLLFIGFLITPSIGLGYSNYNTSSTNQLDNLDLEILSSSLMDESNKNVNLNNNDNNEHSIFDSSLKDYLFTLRLQQQINPHNIKIIVKFGEESSKKQRIEIINLVFNDYEIISNYDIIPATYLKVNAFELMEKEVILNNFKAIKTIYKSEIYKNPYIIDDSLQLSTLNKDSYPNWWVSAIGADNLLYDGTGVRVAVIDTGMYDHPSLNIVANRNFVTDESSSNYNDDVGHGTHVGGIIGGDGTGSQGVYRGIAPGALLINARAGNASGLEEGDIINAIEWSSTPIGDGGAGADIISMSFGGGYPYISDLITEAISNQKEDYGVIFVASAGNDGPDYFTGSTPASGIDVISVGATNEHDELASFSSWGPTYGYIGYPDVVAPGVDIISAEAKNSVISDEMRYIKNYFDFSGDADYIPLSGTSMAAPMVAGALAILKEAFPTITPETARIALLEGAKMLTDKYDDDVLKSGAGLINVSTSLSYLESFAPDYNENAKIFPDNLPTQPYDLLHFPGDHQKFNLTVISGTNNVYDINIPTSIQGVSISVNTPTLTFMDSGIDFIELEIKIDSLAKPGKRNFQINISVGSQIYDDVSFSLDLRLPEQNMLLESFHGLNDWFPDISFNQMGFYEAMKDLAELNISIDYEMEHWTPDYDKNANNSILTEERLAQYDIIVLQNPVLPYSSIEINNLKDYFDNGGNLLFLGTRYQDMVIENINYLFSSLGIDVIINEENIMNDNWLGIGASITSQSVKEFENQAIFNNVNKFFWGYGNTFNVSNNAESIAYLNNKTVAALYDGTTVGKGKFLAFGDLHWIYEQYISDDYIQDHITLLKNVIDYFGTDEEISINIGLESERTSSSQIEISLYLKNQTTESPINSYDSLKLIVNTQSIKLDNSLSNFGIYFNNTYTLPATSYIPYSIAANLTIGSKNFIKNTKILYYDKNLVPQIINLTSSQSSITRKSSDTTTIVAKLDKSTYPAFLGYLSIYSYSFYNNATTVSKTLTFNADIPLTFNTYSEVFDPNINDPSGQAISYIIPSYLNYTNPYSPRYVFWIENNPPEILEQSSTFSIDRNADITFDETETDDGSIVYSASQGSKIDFEVDVRDSVTYEDVTSELKVYVNLFIGTVTSESYVIMIFPSTIVVDNLAYQSISNKFEGRFTIPNKMEYDTIAGTKSIPTTTDFDSSTNQGYLGLLYLTVYDSEGEYEDFIIILLISEASMDLSFLIYIIIPIVGVLVLVGMAVYFAKRKKRTGITRDYQLYSYQPTYEDTYPRSEPTTESSPLLPEAGFYCPFCGGVIKTPKRFCPHCGESLMFNE